MRIGIAFFVAAITLTAAAYLPPVDERCGVKVEIGSFPQKIDRSGKNKFLWPLGVTEVHAGAPRLFPVTLENKTGKAISGELEVWMNDDWDVTGPKGSLSLAPGEERAVVYWRCASAYARRPLSCSCAVYACRRKERRCAAPGRGVHVQESRCSAPRAEDRSVQT